MIRPKRTARPAKITQGTRVGNLDSLRSEVSMLLYALLAGSGGRRTFQPIRVSRADTEYGEATRTMRREDLRSEGSPALSSALLMSLVEH